MRDLRVEARNWFSEVMASARTRSPSRPPRRAVWERCTAAPPPMTGEVLAEARRGVHLAHLACMDTELDAWQSPAAKRKLRVIAETYEPGMPQTCFPPGLLWFFAVMLSGDMERLREIMDASVRTCRETPGYDWRWPAASRCAPTSSPTAPNGRATPPATPTRRWRSTAASATPGAPPRP